MTRRTPFAPRGRRVLLTLAAAVLVPLAPAMAQVHTAPLPVAPPPRPEPALPRLTLSLSAEASLPLENDQATVGFFVEREDPDSARVADAVNRAGRLALERLRARAPSARIQSSGYSTYPVYATGGNRIVGWRARQEIQLVTRELATLPAVIAAGQEVAALGGLAFGVSEEARRAAEGELIRSAVALLRERIGHLARALGREPAEARIEELQLGAPPPPAPRVMAMGARAAGGAMAEPALEAGVTRVTTSVTARVGFRP